MAVPFSDDDGWMDYEVRRVTPADWLAFRELRLEALQDSPLAFTEQYAEARMLSDAQWRQRVTSAASGGEGCLLVAERDGRLVATVGGFVEQEITEQISVMVVGVYASPGHRGSGVAEPLLTGVVDWATTEAGAERIRLFVLAENERAQAFYRRCGFVATGGTMRYPPDPRYLELEMAYRANS